MFHVQSFESQNLKYLHNDKNTCLLVSKACFFVCNSCNGLSFISIYYQSSHGIKTSNFISLMNAHSYTLISVNIKFDIDFLINIVIKRNLKLRDNGCKRIVLDNKKGFNLFLKLLLIQEKVSSWRILSSYFCYPLQ